MQFQVPQFIETEDTIIGSITIRQFIYLSIAGFISFLLYFIFTPLLWLILTLFIGLFAATFAFIKYNGRSLAFIIFQALSYLWKPRMYLWRRKEDIEAMREANAKKGSPLQNLWLKITAGKEAIPEREKGIPQKSKESYDVLLKTTGDKEVARRVDYR